MSKVDAQRAFREARYAPSAAPAVTAAAPAKATPNKVVRTQATATSRPGIDPASQPCGHRSMNGRTCTRVAGHSEKNHRYA